MRGRIETFTDLNQLIEKIPEANSFTLLIEDWDEGFKVKNSQNGGTIKNIVNELKHKYGALFSFKIFNELTEISWNGADGIRAEISSDGDGDYEVESGEIFLEKEYGRFPGLRSLEPNNKAEVQIFRRNGNLIYLKLKGLKEAKDVL